ncbi:MAG: RsmB/NOP family class I SAM-dependent RNA methyltransferase [Chitinophagaceae bacterium]|nr:RsmB/NOP family class I SAM-dependent RNA methyltransferase [Chitinophagaceae bacterium]
MLPLPLIEKLGTLPGLDLPAFEGVHANSVAPTSIRINPLKVDGIGNLFAQSKAVPWCDTGFYLPERPFFAHDPNWHGGAYYVQEASSMALHAVWQQVVPAAREPLRVLDLCAAPGGKSTHLLSLLRADDVLVSNEVISARVNILLENITRWGHHNSMVTQNDPADFSALEGLFDLVLVDAPCSGSGLFRREPQAMQEWSPEVVLQCSRRQQRILSDIWPALKEHGWLVYTTCSFSPEENEEMLDWMCSQFACEPVKLDLPESWHIQQVEAARSGAFGYRFYPHLLQGEGFFLSIMRKKDAAGHWRPRVPAMNKMQIPVDALRNDWIADNHDLAYYRHKDTLYAMAPNALDLFRQLQPALHIRKAGVCLGEWQRNGLQPDHALAMSTLVHPSMPRLVLSREEALQYLRRETQLPASDRKGWQLASFEGLSLGWLKHLGNRINNYYPMEWRLRS